MKPHFAVLVSLFIITAPALAADPAPKEPSIAGTWRVSVAMHGAEPMFENHVKHLQLSLTGKEFTGSFGNFNFLAGPYTSDESKTPKTIDVTGTGDEDKGKVWKGIYALDKDALRICFGEPGEGRPEKFTSTKAYLLVCERKKPGPWLAPWIYDEKQRELPFNATAPNIKIFQRSMTTTDDVDKVCAYYQTVLDKNRLVYTIGNKLLNIHADAKTCGTTFGKGAGGTAEQTLDLAKTMMVAKKLYVGLKELKVDPDLHLYTTAKDDSFTVEDKKEVARPVVVRVATQDTKDYTVTIVVTRAKGEKQTHIFATFVVK